MSFEALSRPARLASLVLAAGFLASLAFGWKWQAQQRSVAFQADMQRLAAFGRASTAGSSGDFQIPVGDFAARLPASAPIEGLVRELQRSSAAANVVLVSVSASPRMASAQTLGRTEVAVQLRGNYSNLKVILAEALSRFPGLVLQHVSIRHAGGTSELEARVDLFMATRAMSPTADQAVPR